MCCKRARQRLVLTSAVCSLGLCAAIAPAATVDWSSAGDGNWNEPSNWTDASDSSNHLPGSGDTADIGQLQSGRTVTINSAVPDIGALQVGFGSSTDRSATLKLETGASLTVTGAARVGGGRGARNTGTVIQNDGTLIVQGGLQIGVGGNTTRQGYYYLNDGILQTRGTDYNADIVIGTNGGGGGGFGTFVQTGGSVVTRDVTLSPQSKSGEAHYTISGGSLTARHLSIGGTNAEQLTSAAEFQVIGSGATISLSGNLEINDNAATEGAHAGSAIGRLVFTIDDGGVSFLSVAGDATLGGDLFVTLADGTTLSDGQVFKLLDIGGTRTGTFRDLGEASLVGTYGDVPLYISYLGGDGNDVILYTAPIPEPMSLGLAGIAAFGLIARRRR